MMNLTYSCRYMRGRRTLAWLAAGIFILASESPALAEGEILGVETKFVSDRRIGLMWDAKLGYAYRLDRTVDLLKYGNQPEYFYGWGVRAVLPIYEAPSPPPAPTAEVFDVPTDWFEITAFANGDALLMYRTPAGMDRMFIPVTGTSRTIDLRTVWDYLPNFGTIDYVVDPEYPESSTRRISLLVFPSYAAASPLQRTIEPIGYPLEVDRLVEHLPEVLSMIASPVPPVPLPTTEDLFDAKGQPKRQYFRLKEYSIDSNGDGQWDHDQLAANFPDIYLEDLDGDGVPNAYDHDLDNDGIPNAQDPSTAGALPGFTHPLLFEAMFENAANAGLESGDPDQSDWIELYNPYAPVDTNDPHHDEYVLDGWHLTDDPANLSKWTFPAGTVIGPGSYLVIFADGTAQANARDAAGRLHCNFKLGSQPTGDYLALVNPSGQIVDDFCSADLPSFGNKRPDLTFGRHYDPLLRQVVCRYFSNPTPRLPNARQAYLGVTPEPEFQTPAGAALPGAVMAGGSVTAALHGADTATTCYFTTNCATPTLDSETYDQPLTFTQTTILRAIASKADWLPSRPVTRSFLFKPDVLSQVRPAGYGAYYLPGQQLIHYAVDPSVSGPHAAEILAELDQVPTVSISVPHRLLFGSAGFYSIPHEDSDAYEAEGSFEWIPATSEDYLQENAGCDRAGEASTLTDRNLKHNIDLRFKKRYSLFGRGVLHGPAKQHGGTPLFPGAAVDEFDQLVVRNPWNTAWSAVGRYLYAQYIPDAWLRESERALGNPATRRRWVHLYLNGLYWGVYDLSEHVDAAWAASLERERHRTAPGFNTAHYEPSGFLVANPSSSASGAVQILGQLQDDLTALFDVSNNGTRFLVANEKFALSEYADYFLANIAGANFEWNSTNWRAFRNTQASAPDQKWHFVCWDGDGCFYDGIWPEVGGFTRPIQGTLQSALSEDPSYRRLFGDRIQKHFFHGGALQCEIPTEGGLARFDALGAEFLTVARAESARWGDAWPHGDLPTPGEAELQEEWAASRITYFPGFRAALLNSARSYGLYPAIDAPTVAPYRNIPANSNVAVTFPAGLTLEYRFDGFDPHLAGGNSSTTSTLIIPIGTAAKRLTARCRQGASTWSALVDLTLTPQP